MQELPDRLFSSRRPAGMHRLAALLIRRSRRRQDRSTLRPCRQPHDSPSASAGGSVAAGVDSSKVSAGGWAVMPPAPLAVVSSTAAIVS